MPESFPIELPGGFAPACAIGIDDGAGRLALIGQGRPMPVFSTAAPDAPPPLAGTTATAYIAGPFVPALLAPVFCTLSGTWEGSVRLLRSTDGGATKLPVTAGGMDWAHFTGNACEAVWQESEAGVSLWLDLRPTSGAVAYRVSQ